MSTTVDGCSMPSRMRSTRFVPPARNFTSVLSAIVRSAVAVSGALT
ncbi:hypothetical protein T45_09368 [Streptomyces turgidiscabies]|nr:hypothetical protein T45_09368 [Streptomyces turgidiscabies]